MSKYTLLEVVQIILSSLDSDEVNSITDTTESMQAVRIAKQAFLNISSRANLPEAKTLFELNASLDPNLPILMYLPQTIQTIDWIKYNKQTVTDTLPNFLTVDYVCLEDFFERMHYLNLNDPNTVQGTLTTNGSDSITLFWKNNIAPSYWTTFDDRTLIFDSYDNTVDTTLQKTKSLAYGLQSSVFTESDSFVPDLDETQHQLWLNEAKSLAWAELKQTAHQKAEQEVRKGWVSLQKTKRNVPSKISELSRLPNYGRSGGGTVVRTQRKGRDSW